MSSYVVKAPYVTLTVSDVNGSDVVQGYYEGAVVENPVQNDSLDKHVRTGLVEKVSSRSSAAAEKAAEQPASPKK